MADYKTLEEIEQREITNAVNKLVKRQAEKQELIEMHIERLLFAGIQKGLITDDDVFVVRNGLLGFFGIEKPYAGRINKTDRHCLPEILHKLTTLAAAKGLCRNTEQAKEDYSSKIMGFLTPRASEVVSKWNELYKEGPAFATDWFFGFSHDVDYIKASKRNISWIAETEFGYLDITINVSKPEKDPADIEAAKNAPQKGYPKCLLCPQAAGYGGNANYPARDNHRIIPLKLNNKHWYFQFSPYQYYNEHCIVLYENHVPMKISEKTFIALFDFVEQFPHYFIGSNADLPIVGGSILVHEHYQGGRQKFAMESAPVLKTFRFCEADGVTASIIKWPLSTIRLTGKDRTALMAAAMKITDTWREYFDERIVAFNTENEQGIKIHHNTVTPILRRKNGGYELDLALRSNLTSDEFPLGIYHPHEDVWHIKKENIGLIEVMGLAVLPARLVGECAKIRKVLTGETRGKSKWDNNGMEWEDDRSDGFLYEENPELEKHKDWIRMLIVKYGTSNTETDAKEILEREIGHIFAKVLDYCGVFPRDEQGQRRFCAFMSEAGFGEIRK